MSLYLSYFFSNVCLLLIFLKTFRFLTKIDVPQLSTVCTKFAEDEERIYGVPLPRWCMTGEDLPDVYKVIERHVTLKGSDRIEDQLHHIKGIAKNVLFLENGVRRNLELHWA